MLERLQATVCGRLGVLHKLIDAVALLDMLQSLAHAVGLSDEEYSRPSVSESGASRFAASNTISASETSQLNHDGRVSRTSGSSS